MKRQTLTFFLIATLALVWGARKSRASDASPIQRDETKALLRDSATHIREAFDNRYSGLAASAGVYESALDNMFSVRSRLEHDQDGTLTARSVKDLANAYDRLEAACKKTAKEAQHINKEHWPETYNEEVAELNTALRQDEEANRTSRRERERLKQISARSISENSDLDKYESNVQQTQLRISIYTKSLEVYKEIDDLVNRNDKMISDYETVYNNMAFRYADAAKTLRATYRYQRLKEVEQMVLAIIKQPEQLQQESEKALSDWTTISRDLTKIIGAP